MARWERRVELAVPPERERSLRDRQDGDGSFQSETPGGLGRLRYRSLDVLDANFAKTGPSEHERQVMTHPAVFAPPAVQRTEHHGRCRSCGVDVGEPFEDRPRRPGGRVGGWKGSVLRGARASGASSFR